MSVRSVSILLPTHSIVLSVRELLPVKSCPIAYPTDYNYNFQQNFGVYFMQNAFPRRPQTCSGNDLFLSHTPTVLYAPFAL